jgi:protein arginine kinase activator
MLCDICKEHEATIHIQEIINNQKKAMNLCSECAVDKSQNDPSFDFGGFNLAEMLYNISESQGGIPGLTPMSDEESIDENDKSRETKETNDLKCINCGWTLKALRRTGRVGCPECYNMFREVIENALENMHRGKLHVGKRPGSQNTERSSNFMLKLMKLQKELDEVIQREEYEKAAKLRDKITALKKKINAPKPKKKNVSK